MTYDDEDDDDDGSKGKREGIERAGRNANAAWIAGALETLLKLCYTMDTLTTDDIWPNISPNLYTHEPRAMGWVTTDAQRRGWIEKEPVPNIPSVRKVCHQNPKQVWRSLLFRGQVDPHTEIIKDIMAEVGGRPFTAIPLIVKRFGTTEFARTLMRRVWQQHYRLLDKKGQ